MGVEDPSEVTQMRLRYAGTCAICAAALPPKTVAVYDRLNKTVLCLDCGPVITPLGAPGPVVVQDATAMPMSDGSLECSAHMPPAESGTAGLSARREFEKRKARREDRVRAAHPKLGGLILALSEDPQSTRAWHQGAVGEERLGARLDGLASDSVSVLHDRRIPGTRANIDHIAVAGTGVWVIDAKRYKGRPTLRVEGGILRPQVARLFVGRRDCTKLVEGVARQIAVVTEALAGAGLHPPVRGALAFVDADWPLVGGAFSIQGVHVLWPKRLAKMLAEPGDVEDLASIHQVLARRLPPA